MSLFRERFFFFLFFFFNFSPFFFIGWANPETIVLWNLITESRRIGKRLILGTGIYVQKTNFDGQEVIDAWKIQVRNVAGGPAWLGWDIKKHLRMTGAPDP